MFQLALYFKQAGTMLPFLDIPLKGLVAASTRRETVLGCKRRGGRGRKGGIMEMESSLES